MSTLTNTLLPEDLKASAPLFDIVDEGLEVLDEERELFLTGGYENIPAITERKLQVLERLEAAIPAAPRSATVINAVKRLIAASRRNEQIIQAARQGLAHAKRRIGAILDSGRGVVAYAEDGSRIASSSDLIKNDRSA